MGGRCIVLYRIEWGATLYYTVDILSGGQMVQESHMAGDTGSTGEGECIFAPNILRQLYKVTTMMGQSDKIHRAISKPVQCHFIVMQ